MCWKDQVLSLVLSCLAACMDGRNANSNHKNFLLTGAGGAGKTALLAVMAEVFGGDAATSYADTFLVSMLCSKHGAHTMADPALFFIKGKRLISTTEPGPREATNDTFVNKLTGGGGEGKTQGT